MNQPNITGFLNPCSANSFSQRHIRWFPNEKMLVSSCQNQKNF